MKATHFLVALLLVTMLPLMASAQYNVNPYWQWAKADSARAMPALTASSVLAVKNGKSLWGRMMSISRYDAGNAQGSYVLDEWDSTGRKLNLTVMLGKMQLLDAQADAAGNWYILGRFWDSVVFANGTVLLRPSPATNPDANHFMVRLNAGTLGIGWAKTIGPLVTQSARAFTLDANRVYVPVDSENSTVVRALSLTNGMASTLFTQNGASTTTSIQVDGSGNIYLAGGCAYSGINFNGATEAATAPDAYGYIVKYNSAGAHQWHYWFNNPECMPRKLTFFKNNVLYYTGGLRDTMILGGNVSVHPDRGGYYAARLNAANGGIVWTRTLDTMGGGGAVPGDPYHAVVTADTALVLFLEGNGFINWGDTFSTNLQGVSHSAVLAALSASDSVRWVRSVYAQFTSNAHVATEGDAIWVCGGAYSPNGQVLLDTLQLAVPPLLFTPYMARLKLTPRPKVISPGAVGSVAGEEFSVAPVPARYALRIGGMNRGGTATLRDITGREAARITITAGSSRDALMDVAALPRGAYMLELRGSDGMLTMRKVVLE